MIKALATIKQQIEQINEYNKKTGFSSSLGDFKVNLDYFNELKQLQNNLTTLKQKSSTGSNKSQNKQQQQAPSKQQQQENDQQLVNNFMVWLKQNGFDESKSKVKINRNLAEGTGLVATTEIKEGEEFLEIPAKLFITQNSAFQSFGQQSIEILYRDSLIRRVPSLILVIYLIKELSNPDSSIAPYLKILPKTYNHISYWTFEDYKQLEGSPTLLNAIRYASGTMRQYCYLYQLFDNNPGIIQTTNFTYETFIWAIATVQSRQNPVLSSTGQEVLALIPFWDFLNHTAQGKITSFYDPSKNSMSCSALKNYKQGDQVYMYYGPRSNTQFLLFQGFTLKTNLNDDYQFEMELTGNNKDIVHDKIHILEDKCGLRNYQEVSLSQNPSSDQLPAELIPFYRIDALSDEDTKKIAPKQEDGHHHHHHGPMNMKPEAFEIISEENEKKAFETVLNVLKKSLSNYPTTLAEDEQEMKKNPSTQRRYILYLLISEKKILERNIKYIEQLIEKGVMNANLKKIEFNEEDLEDQDQCGEDHDHSSHGHSHSGGNHGHSHSGGNHGHSHSGGNHGHSHGGSHGHKH